MMLQKRKAPSPAHIQRDQKKPKKKKARAPPPSEFEPEIGEEEFDVNCILDEDDIRYYIDWEGPYSPTWVSLGQSLRPSYTRAVRGSWSGKRN